MQKLQSYGVSGAAQASVRIVCIALAGMAAVLVFALPASADTELDPVAEKLRWQTKYRFLLVESERLRAEIDKERELYADANRRNYRRGTKRHGHRAKVQAAERELALIEAELETFEDDARRGGALRGWLTQIEIELEDAAEGDPVTAGPGDEGRNPLYLED